MVNAGRILIMPKGDWNALTTYDMLDLVAYNGIAYLARQTNIGQNPSTDTSMTYWQPFGSASSIATTTSPGLVMPDDESIKIDNTGKINVNIDNNTIVYDSVNGYLKAAVSSALANLTDVNITSAQNGQALVYDSTSQTWENTTLYGDGIALSSLDSTTITGAIGALQAPTFTEAQTRANVATGETVATLWGKVKKWFSDLTSGVMTSSTFAVDLTNWSTDTTSQSGVTLYKKAIPVTNVYMDCPTVDIGCASGSTIPTSAQQTSYNLLQYATVDDSVPCIYLYASAIPTTAFYIKVKGVD